MNGSSSSQYPQLPVQGFTPNVFAFEDAPSVPYSSYRFSSASSHLKQSYLFRDPVKFTPIETEMSTSKNARNRRDGISGAGGEPVKHRRTRSGCLTCRSRRVKCDEGRPICERCLKGKRDCNYSDSATSLKSRNKASKKGKNEPNSDGEEGDDDKDILPSIDENESSSQGQTPDEPDRVTGSVGSSTRNQQPDNISRTPSLTTDQGQSPSSSSGYSGASPKVASRSIDGVHSRESSPLDQKTLPPDVKFYLNYYIKSVTSDHYSFKANMDYVLHNAMLEEALKYEPLLQAIVGFSAYLYTLENPNGRIQDFLQYYNKAVSLLLRNFKKGAKNTWGTLLTILQLACIEELLGDWVNLLGHQRAACALLLELFTPQSIMESPLGRLTLSWYCRFDLYGALIGGYSSSLPLEWFTYGQDYSNRKVEEARGTEEYVPAIIDKALTDIRFLAMEISNMSCAVTKGRMSFPDYFVKEIELTKRLKAWHADLDPVLYDPRYCVTDFSDCPPPDPNDIVDPYQPGLIYDGPIWPMTILQQDFLGLYLMMKYMTVELKQLKEGSPEYSEIQRLSFSACQIFESVALWPRSPKGAVIGVQACIGMGCVLFPKDDRHMWWLRKSMAIIERAGYIYAPAFRAKIAKIFDDPSVEDWWLPNDEGRPRVLKEIYDFVRDRSAEPKDEMQDDLKEMKQVFKSLSLDD